MLVKLNSLVEELEAEGMFDQLVIEIKEIVGKLMTDDRIENLKEEGVEDSLQLVMSLLSLKMGNVSAEVFSEYKS